MQAGETGQLVFANYANSNKTYSLVNGTMDMASGLNDPTSEPNQQKKCGSVLQLVDTNERSAQISERTRTELLSI